MGYRQPSDYEPVVPAPRSAPVESGASDVSSLTDTNHLASAPPLHDAGSLAFASADAGDFNSLKHTSASPAATLDAFENRGDNAPLKFDRRAHLISFAGLFLFTVVLYFRPYELFSFLSGFNSMAFVIAVPTLIIFFVTQFTREGNLTARPREVNLVLLLVVAALLSIPLALSRGDAWDEFISTFIKAVMMFIVMVNTVRTERRLRALLWLALAVSCFLAVNAISDFHAGRLNLRGERVAGVVGGMFGNPNDMALHLVTMIPVAIAFFFMRRNPLSKLAYAACAALLAAGIVVSFSRGGFLGLLAAATVLAWKLARRHRLAVGLCAMLAIGALVIAVPGDYIARLGTITSASSDQTGSSSQRQALLVRSLQVTARHPLLGIGMGNFHIVSIHEFVSHNAYTQVSAELGLAALAIYLWFLIAPLRRLREIERATFDARRASHFYYLAVGLQAALVGYMVSSFFASVAYNFYVYYLVGYAVALRRLYKAACLEGDEQTMAARAPDTETTEATNDAAHTRAGSYA